MKIQYFAWMKDEMGTAGEEVDLPGTIRNVGQLIDWLSTRSDRHQQAFEFIETVKVVVNGQNADMDQPVSNEDDVIFIPPVAGG